LKVLFDLDVDEVEVIRLYEEVMGKVDEVEEEGEWVEVVVGNGNDEPSVVSG
jgi:hypothetical protein